MDPGFGFGFPTNEGSPATTAIQNSNVLIVTKIAGMGDVPFTAPVPVVMGFGESGSMPMGWNDPHGVAQGAAPQLHFAPGTPLSHSHYTVKNHQNMDIAKIEPLPANAFALRGTAGDEILHFSLGLNNTNQPAILLSLATGQIIGSLSSEQKPGKADKHKDKPKKDKKKDKDHKEGKSKDEKKQLFVLRSHDGQPMFSFSGKSKVKDGGKMEMKIKSFLDQKDDESGEVESLGANAGFQIKFKSSQGHGMNAANHLQKCQILASVVGILDLFPKSTMPSHGPPMMGMGMPM